MLSVVMVSTAIVGTAVTRAAGVGIASPVGHPCLNLPQQLELLRREGLPLLRRAAGRPPLALHLLLGQLGEYHAPREREQIRGEH
jgi:hypothetical protein